MKVKFEGKSYEATKYEYQGKTEYAFFPPNRHLMLQENGDVIEEFDPIDPLHCIEANWKKIGIGELE